LIMDEPTSVLTPQAVRKLFETLRLLASEGCSILYISHKLDEIQELCHTATVLRAGKVTGTCIPSQETAKSMARLMIGRDLPVCEHGQPAARTDPRLRIAGLSRAADDQFGTALKDMELTVFAGEIVGIAGVSGNGQQELLYALSGEEPIAEKYPVQICGTEAGRMRAGRRRRLGLGFVPEERLGRGAVPRMSLADNALLTGWRQAMLKFTLIDRTAVRAFAATVIAKFNVKCGGPGAQARSLSGGNLQKFIVGREILLGPKVLIVAQPTWGVDVGAAAFIRQALIDLRNAGTAVLVVSEELDELFEICDRIAVIANGELSPAKAVAETNVEEIGVWMSGMWPRSERPEAELA
jgi:simple sugar transport system ATP-binding protein